MAKPHKHAEVIKAWAEGKRIRWRFGPDAPWEYSDCEGYPNASFGDDAEYEIAPELLRGWVNVYKYGITHVYESREEADACAGEDRIRCVEMVEVTNDD